jgi:hypothetical protein
MYFQYPVSFAIKTIRIGCEVGFCQACCLTSHLDGSRSPAYFGDSHQNLNPYPHCQTDRLAFTCRGSLLANLCRLITLYIMGYINWHLVCCVNCQKAGTPPDHRSRSDHAGLARRQAIARHVRSSAPRYERGNIISRWRRRWTKIASDITSVKALALMARGSLLPGAPAESTFRAPRYDYTEPDSITRKKGSELTEPFCLISRCRDG